MHQSGAGDSSLRGSDSDEGSQEPEGPERSGWDVDVGEVLGEGRYVVGQKALDIFEGEVRKLRTMQAEALAGYHEVRWSGNRPICMRSVARDVGGKIIHGVSRHPLVVVYRAHDS